MLRWVTGTGSTPHPRLLNPGGHKAMCLSFPEQGFPEGPPRRPLVRLPGTGHAPSRRLPMPDRSLLDHMELNSAFFAVRLLGDCVRGLLHPSDYAGPSLGATRRPQAPPLGPQPHRPAMWGPPGAPQCPESVLRGDALASNVFSQGSALPRPRGPEQVLRPELPRLPVRATVSPSSDSSGAGPGRSSRLCPLSSVVSLRCIAATVTKYETFLSQNEHLSKNNV